MPLRYTGSNQRVTEYHAWTCLCIGLGAKTYLELGCGSSHEQAEAGMRVLTVDVLPNGLGGIEHLQADSHDPLLPELVRHTLGSDPDIVFIDADHSYDAVRLDFQLWWPHAQIAVGFHDILMDGVRQFWDEISRQHPSVQIVSRDIASADQWQHGCPTHTGDVNCGGIGVLFK